MFIAVCIGRAHCKDLLRSMVPARLTGKGNCGLALHHHHSADCQTNSGQTPVRRSTATPSPHLGPLLLGGYILRINFLYTQSQL